MFSSFFDERFKSALKSMYFWIYRYDYIVKSCYFCALNTLLISKTYFVDGKESWKFNSKYLFYYKG